MSGAATAEAVLSAVARVIGAERIPPGAGADLCLFAQGLWLSSLELMEVVVACEETFGVFLDPERDLTDDALRTVGSLAEQIEAVRRTRGKDERA